MLQGVIMGLPARSAEEDAERRAVLDALAPAQRADFDSFVESEVRFV